MMNSPKGVNRALKNALAYRSFAGRDFFEHHANCASYTRYAKRVTVRASRRLSKALCADWS